MRGERAVISSSRKRRRSPGSPFTSARSSGANSTVRTIPSTSRGLTCEDLLIRARFALPGLSSSSTSCCRSPCLTCARTIARSAPIRTRGASEATRWLPRVAREPIASTRFVLPCPLGPTNAVTPGSSGTSTRAYERKSANDRCVTCMVGRRPPPGCGLRLWMAPQPCGLLRLDRVAAELVAQRRDHLHLRRVVLTGREPREQRRGDRRQRHRVVYGGFHGPPALAGVLCETAQLVQVLVLVEGVDREVEEPGTDDRALLPGAEDLPDVGHGVDLLQELPALGIGLHHRVLDAVVDHLREVAGADLASVHRTGVALGLEGVEDRLHLGDVLRVTAVHQRVAVLQAPHTTGDAAVDEADALGGQLPGVLLVVRPAGVPAVHHHVTGLQELGQLVDGRLGRRAGRDHHPHDPRALQRVHKLLQAVDIGEVRVAVVSDHGEACAADPLAHVAAHLAEADETELHQWFLRLLWRESTFVPTYGA